MASALCSHLFSIEIITLKFSHGSKNEYFTFNHRKNAAIASNHKLFKARQYTQKEDILRQFSAIQRQFWHFFKMNNYGISQSKFLNLD
jgi:hypothetical protein